jgi:hypothetical protein
VSSTEVHEKLVIKKERKVTKLRRLKKIEHPLT